ncbi:MAG TPA: acetate--CoA ligase, partial [Fibrobacteria bacterium]|nr:acetate--CoA ligase [Fibrobacteria bacterium]
MSQNIESVLRENRTFPPPADFAKRAAVGSFAEYEALHKRSVEQPEAFWAEQAESLDWFRKWDRVLDWSNPPFAKWFEGGTLNASFNCLDRHLATRGDKTAILWEGEPGDRRTLTYRQLHAEVCRFANALKARGVKAGDSVALYMPLVPELVIAMLACARIGAPHSIIFGGFSAPALVDRIHDASSVAVVTADGGWRRGQVVPLKHTVDEALKNTPSVKTCIVLKRTAQPIDMVAGRDIWWDDAIAGVSEENRAAELPAEHPLYVLYTSGSTGKPKGILHTTGGYLLGAMLTTRYVFDLRDDDVYWCTADIGWVTGHSYVAYGPLANGATVVMYEGAPNHPDVDRFWDIAERYKVSVFYTAPTAIRAFMKWGDDAVRKHDLSSLRLLGSVGEPINPEAWMWYRDVIGGGRCPVVDTWWQTETGGILVSPLPGATPTKPGSATLPVPGIDADVVTRSGEPVGPNQGGYLVIRRPWPAMMRTIYNDPDRYVKQYWSDIPGLYFAGDGARRDEDG